YVYVPLAGCGVGLSTSKVDVVNPRPIRKSLIRFVGRQQQVKKAIQLIDTGCRLLTIHGFGGTGKTRLAIELSAQMKSRFAGRVAFVDLVNATTADEIYERTGEALNLGSNDRTRIVRALSADDWLLVMD